ncbi:hypothetical protein C7S18_02395 [Ahniella affigens]|uniref:Isoaspartyl peptidase n=1 Tax=Ahniella affigens TaxID=2021234 RepID=A0A2P1PMP3_9GAMM|nr:isoaspartyl peptidase/L-asparaginase [Ahniella affigens]AVP96113.1 hypothetical protein C7S18_02395 [Ahniella affigens]
MNRLPILHQNLAGLALLALLSLPALAATQESRPAPIALAIHGGAGTLLRAEMSAEQEQQYRAVLGQALDAGYAVLKSGGASLDAVQATILVMEDSPLFNAGKGAVFTSDGKHELDAAVMTGHDLRAGSVAGITQVKNPILAARAVMEQSEHVMLTGPGADTFARTQGLAMVDNHYFDTEFRWQQLLKLRGEPLDTPMPGSKSANAAAPAWRAEGRKFGTVGAVALDQAGHLAAGTSTGGMTNKRWGRVGDAPVIGAGTYANAECAVSATGHGEFFIRVGVAHEICARIRFKGESPAAAARYVVQDTLKPMQAEGGVIVLGRDGRFALEFNSPGMYRGVIDVHGKREIAIFGTDDDATPLTGASH